MTGLLHDTLDERAGSMPSSSFDAQQVIDDGRRRVRRRRLVAGLATLSVAGVLGAGAVVGPGLPDAAPRPNDRTATGGPAFPDRRIGYAEGSTIHWGTQAFDVGTRVASYVQTDDGFVWTARTGDVFFFDGTRSVPAGRSETGRLRTDDTGSVVAWLDLAEDGTPEYVVYDTDLPGVTDRIEQPTILGPAQEGDARYWDNGAQVYAVDDGSIYWRGADADLVRYDLGTSTETVLLDGAGIGHPGDGPDVPIEILDVAGGRIAYRTDGSAGPSTWVGTSLDPARSVRMPTGTDGHLSPDGGRLVVEQDDAAALYDTSTGAALPFAPRGYAFAVGFGWEDDSSVTAVGIKDLSTDPYDVDFLRCGPEGGCTVAGSERVPADDGERIVTPTGDPAT
ncbi:hypothetical protein [Nocardioides mesophilus]|uniref:WD40 repeat domain-containing protein n=1 Tax=Nocardioides mesophilus TaxID=433659 RepID=A0A7G9RBG5_9ACTN|nr:hypothetical protein [Nocardioides mesophilus]QNN52940.1 hypothetical protein H9L09_21435 [Nocardioides mesophilus]